MAEIAVNAVAAGATESITGAAQRATRSTGLTSNGSERINRVATAAGPRPLTAPTAFICAHPELVAKSREG